MDITTKFLYLKLDPVNLTSWPVKVSDVPFIFDNTIPKDELELGLYSQIKLTGDAFDIKTIEQLLLPVNKTTVSTDFLSENNT